jgi:hypothetical protein
MDNFNNLGDEPGKMKFFLVLFATTLQVIIAILYCAIFLAVNHVAALFICDKLLCIATSLIFMYIMKVEINFRR